MSFTRLPSATEEEWLAQRREYVTATEIARLAASPAEWPRIRHEKEHGSDFHGNAVTRWGHEREPEIGEFVRVFVDSRLTGNTDLCVLDGSRIAATPDMLPDNLSTGCEVIGEIKTSGKQLIPDHIPQKYRDQVQVQLLVTGAEACVFACEVRGEDETGFFPDGLPKTTVILPDLDRQAELVDIAERFLAGGEPDTGATPDGLQNLVWDYFDAKSQMEDALGAIKEIVGTDPDTYLLEGAKVIVTADGKSTRLDAKALERDHPGITAHYMVTSARKGSVKIQKDRQKKAAA